MTNFSSRREAATLAFLAAILWATYYPFVLWLSPDVDGAVLAFPFLFGGLPFLVVAARRTGGGWADALAPLRTREGLLAGVLLVAMQADVVVSTRLAGAVTTAILTLLGDVALIPAMNLVLWNEGREQVMRPVFWGGVAVATFGGTLSIVGGGGVTGLSGTAWLVALPLPFLVGAYFLLVARLSRTTPTEHLVASASLLAFAIAAVGAVLLTGIGGFPGPLDSRGWVLLVVLGVTSFFLGPWFFFESARRLSVVVPAVINATIPVFTLLFVVVLLGTTVAWVAVLGVPLAFLGGALALMGPGTRSTPSSPPT